VSRKCTFGDLVRWAWVYAWVSAVTALRSDPGVLRRELARLDKATAPFARAAEEQDRRAAWKRISAL
jgi:hypothetical protein